MKTNMKPIQQTSTYYEYDDVWKYVCEKYGFSENDKFEGDKEIWYGFWQYLCENNDIHNGCYIYLTDWEQKHNNGEFAKKIPTYVKEVTNKILDEFGEVDTECLTPNTRIVKLWASW